jgi:hypothetical protein
MREIARLVEGPSSPLRHWFQRKSEQREKAPETRVHESTVMRWLEKVYSKTLKSFCNELSGKHSLKQAEIELCMEIAAQDLAGSEIYQNLLTTRRNSTNI